MKKWALRPTNQEFISEIPQNNTGKEEVMATIKEIAQKLGVSVSTVSKGLNGGSDISEELRQQILDIAVEIGYRTKHSKKVEHRKLCILIENMDYATPEDFGYEIVLGFKQIASREKWQVDVIDVTKAMEQEEKYDTWLLKHGYSGAFLAGFAFDDRWTDQLQDTRMPTVLLDNSIPYNFNVCEVGTDSREGITLAVEHLYRLGHRRIAFLNGSRGSLVTSERQEAFEAAMRQRDLKLDPGLSAYGYYVPEVAADFVPGFLAGGATAIVCASDLIAQGVLEECHKAGKRVPEDVSVIGYDDIRLAEELEPQLTTIRQERNMMGRQAYVNLFSLIHNIPVAKTVLRPRLIVRQSTGPAPIV